MKISPYWCASSCEEDAKRLYDILKDLNIGDLFIYKLDYLNSNNFAGTDTYHTIEYVLMQRTGKCYFDDSGNTRFDDTTELNVKDVICFYNFAETLNDNIKTYSTDELAELKLKLAIKGKEFEELPIFEISYDNRTTLMTNAGQIIIF